MANILIIDDNVDICKFLKTLLEKNGHTAKVVLDGGEGVQLCKTFNYDIVITDIFMPSKDGLETIREIKRINKDVKIVAISGEGSIGHPEDFLNIAKKLGAIYTFKKPLDPKALIEVINNISTGNI